MELTRKQTVESLKELGRFLKMLDHFDYIRDAMAHLDETMATYDGMLVEARHARSQAIEEADALVIEAEKKYNARQEDCERAEQAKQTVLNRLMAAIELQTTKQTELQSNLAVLATAIENQQKIQVAEQAAHTRVMQDLQANIAKLKTEATQLSNRFKF